MNFIKLTPGACERMGNERRRTLARRVGIRTYWLPPKILKLFIILQKKWAVEKA